MAVNLIIESIAIYNGSYLAVASVTDCSFVSDSPVSVTYDGTATTFSSDYANKDVSATVSADTTLSLTSSLTYHRFETVADGSTLTIDPSENAALTVSAAFVASSPVVIDCTDIPAGTTIISGPIYGASNITAKEGTLAAGTELVVAEDYVQVASTGVNLSENISEDTTWSTFIQGKTWTDSVLSTITLNNTASSMVTLTLDDVTAASIKITGSPVKIVKASNATVTIPELIIPKDVIVEFDTASTIPFEVVGDDTGAGTVRYNLGETVQVDATSLSLDFSKFTGSVLVDSGRIKWTTALPSAITLKVDDGGQAWLSGLTWSGPIVLDGNGYGGDTGYPNLQQAPVRFSGTVKVTGAFTANGHKDTDGTTTVAPKIAMENSTAVTMSGVVSMPDGFTTTFGSGTLTFTTPADDTITGTVTLSAGNVVYGTNAGGSAGKEMKCGDSLVVESGRTFTLHTWTTQSVDATDTGKVKFMSAVTLKGTAILNTQDGSYCFNSLSLASGATASMTMGYGKGWRFNTLNIPSGATLTTALTYTDGTYREVYYSVYGGTCAGTLKLQNNCTGASANTRFSTAESVFANGTVEFTGSHSNFLAVVGTESNGFSGTAKKTGTGAVRYMGTKLKDATFDGVIFGGNNLVSTSGTININNMTANDLTYGGQYSYAMTGSGKLNFTGTNDLTHKSDGTTVNGNAKIGIGTAGAVNVSENASLTALQVYNTSGDNNAPISVASGATLTTTSGSSKTIALNNCGTLALGGELIAGTITNNCGTISGSSTITTTGASFFYGNCTMTGFTGKWAGSGAINVGATGDASKAGTVDLSGFAANSTATKLNLFVNSKAIIGTGLSCPVWKGSGATLGVKGAVSLGANAITENCAWTLQPQNASSSLTLTGDIGGAVTVDCSLITDPTADSMTIISKSGLSASNYSGSNIPAGYLLVVDSEGVKLAKASAITAAATAVGGSVVLSEDQKNYGCMFSNVTVASGKSVTLTYGDTTVATVAGGDSGKTLAYETTSKKWNGETGSWSDTTKWLGGVVPTASDTAVVPLDKGVELTMDGTVTPTAVTLTGSGTIVFTAKPADVFKTSLQAATWTGTLRFEDVTFDANFESGKGLVFANYGNSGSTIAFKNCSGYWYVTDNDTTVKPAVELIDGDETIAFSRTDGWNGKRNVYAALKGSGTFSSVNTKPHVAQAYLFTEKASSFRGSILMATTISSPAWGNYNVYGPRIVFGDTTTDTWTFDPSTSPTTTGMIEIDTGYEATLAADQTWQTYNGISVLGTLNLERGATIVGVGPLTFGANGTAKVTLGSDTISAPTKLVTWALAANALPSAEKFTMATGSTLPDGYELAVKTNGLYAAKTIALTVTKPDHASVVVKADTKTITGTDGIYSLYEGAAVEITYTADEGYCPETLVKTIASLSETDTVETPTFVLEENAEASIGDTKYATIQQAIDVAGDDNLGTITIVYTDTTVIPTGYTYTFSGTTTNGVRKIGTVYYGQGYLKGDMTGKKDDSGSSVDAQVFADVGKTRQTYLSTGDTLTFATTVELYVDQSFNGQVTVADGVTVTMNAGSDSGMLNGKTVTLGSSSVLKLGGPYRNFNMGAVTFNGAEGSMILTKGSHNGPTATSISGTTPVTIENGVTLTVDSYPSTGTVTVKGVLKVKTENGTQPASYAPASGGTLRVYTDGAYTVYDGGEVAMIVSDAGATTNYYATISAALEAAGTTDDTTIIAINPIAETAANISIPSNVTLKLRDSATDNTLFDNATFDGAGTVELKAWPSDTTVRVTDDWTGTVVFPDITERTYFETHLNAWGVVGSTVRLGNIGNSTSGGNAYVTSGGTINPTVEIKDGKTVYINNGWDSSTTTFKGLSGSGTLYVAFAPANAYTVKIEKLNGFTGTLSTGNTKDKIVVDTCVLSETPAENAIVIKTGTINGSFDITNTAFQLANGTNLRETWAFSYVSGSGVKAVTATVEAGGIKYGSLDAAIAGANGAPIKLLKEIGTYSPSGNVTFGLDVSSYGLTISTTAGQIVTLTSLSGSQAVTVKGAGTVVIADSGDPLYTGTLTVESGAALACECQYPWATSTETSPESGTVASVVVKGTLVLNHGAYTTGIALNQVTWETGSKLALVDSVYADGRITVNNTYATSVKPSSIEVTDTAFIALDGVVSKEYTGYNEYTYTPRVSGSACLLDFTFTNDTATVTSTSAGGRIKPSSTCQLNDADHYFQFAASSTAYYTNAVEVAEGVTNYTALMMSVTPWRGQTEAGVKEQIIPTNGAPYTVAFAATFPRGANTCIFACGSAWNSLFLATGTDANHIQLLRSKSSEGNYSVPQSDCTLLTTMNVPYGDTAQHTIVFETDDHLTFNIYVDGTRWTTYTFTSEVDVGTGWQIGGWAGGGVVGYNKADAAAADAADAYVSALRLYDGAMGTNAIALIAKEFPYKSPAVSYDRLLTTADTAWKQTGKWVNKTNATEMLDQPIELSRLVITNTTSETVTLDVNLVQDVEALEFQGLNGSIKLAAGTGKLTSYSTVHVATDMTIEYGSLDISEVPVTIADGKKLTYDMSDVDMGDYYVITTNRITGVMTAPTAGSEKENWPLQVTFPTTSLRYAFDYIYRESDHSYCAVLTPNQSHIEDSQGESNGYLALDDSTHAIISTVTGRDFTLPSGVTKVSVYNGNTDISGAFKTFTSEQIASGTVTPELDPSGSVGDVAVKPAPTAMTGTDGTVSVHMDTIPGLWYAISTSTDGSNWAIDHSSIQQADSSGSVALDTTPDGTSRVVQFKIHTAGCRADLGTSKDVTTVLGLVNSQVYADANAYGMDVTNGVTGIGAVVYGIKIADSTSGDFSSNMFNTVTFTLKDDCGAHDKTCTYYLKNAKGVTFATATSSDGKVTFANIGSNQFGDGSFYLTTDSTNTYTMGIASYQWATGDAITVSGATNTVPLNMLANTPYKDGLKSVVTTCTPDSRIDPSNQNPGSVYRIPAVAKGAKSIVAMFDCRYYNHHDLGVTTWDSVKKVAIDQAECVSTDGGETWTKPEVVIDVANYSSDTAASAGGTRRDLDIGDPCLGYLGGTFYAMAETGAGLQGGWVNQDLVVYKRAEDSTEWIPFGGANGERSVQAAVSNAVVAAGETWPSGTSAILQGPGHAVVNPIAFTTNGNANVNFAANSYLIFPMQLFDKSSGSNVGRCFATWTDGTSWWATKLAPTGNDSQENSITVLDNGYWYMMCKDGGNSGKNNDRLIYVSTNHVDWTKVAVQFSGETPGVQGSLLKVKAGTDTVGGKYVACMCTGTKSDTSINGSGRKDIMLFYGTDTKLDPATYSTDTTARQPITWCAKADATMVYEGTTGAQGYTSLTLIDDNHVGILFEANKHIYFKIVDISGVTWPSVQ